MQGKGKVIALVGILGLLLVVVAYMYWDDVFPPKPEIPPAPAPTENPQPANQPARPGQQPDTPKPPANQPPVISG
jgi:hypothetical protein